MAEILRAGRLFAVEGLSRRHLRNSVRDVFEHVEPGHSLCGEKLRGIGLVLLEGGREHIARLHLLPSGALHVKHGSLQHTAERERLFRFLLLGAAELLDRFFEVLFQIFPELRQIGAAGPKDPLAVRIVRQGVEQVLEGEVGMLA